MDDIKTGSVKLCVLLFAILLLNIFPAFAGSVYEKSFTNSLSMKFVLIQPGSFIMGSPEDESHRSDTEVQHKVTITRPFYMQTTEVTVVQWEALMGKKFFAPPTEKGNRPVVKVSWHDCMTFITKLNALNKETYRLPTEAEWEYACRAGSSTAYSWGKTIECDKAMFSNNTLKSRECVGYVESKGLGVDRPALVKSYPPNAWGLYDMHGNVWEWCQDYYGVYPSGPVTDPAGSKSGPDKVRRGGSWFKYGYSCRSANRAYAHEASRFQTTGFRLVREVQ